MIQVCVEGGEPEREPFQLVLRQAQTVSLSFKFKRLNEQGIVDGEHSVSYSHIRLYFANGFSMLNAGWRTGAADCFMCPLSEHSYFVGTRNFFCIWLPALRNDEMNETASSEQLLGEHGAGPAAIVV